MRYVDVIFLRNMGSLFMFMYSQILWLNTVTYKLFVLITSLLFLLASVAVAYQGGGWGVQTPPEIPKISEESSNT